jgi:hypothetical protein
MRRGRAIDVMAITKPRFFLAGLERRSVTRKQNVKTQFV